jgi:hypothetical protein
MPRRGVREKVAKVKQALMLGIAGCAIMASAACGGGGGGGLKGHSPAYEAGYKAGDNFTNMQLQMATMSCANAYEQAKGGINEDDFIHGCIDAAQKHGGTFDTSTPSS